MLVHDAGDRLVFERLAFHDVAPVAGRIADAEQDRLVLVPGAAERFFAPGVPIDRIVRVLKQVGADLIHQVVGIFVFRHMRAS